MNDNCPLQEELRRYLLGDLIYADADEITEHLKNCESCATAVTQLDSSSDDLILQLRRPVPESSYIVEDGCRRAMRAIDDLPDETEVHQSTDGILKTDLDKLAGQRLRDYELQMLIGSGGMGAVYQAMHLRLKKVVAIKVLPQERTSNERYVARFLQEMEACGRIEHKNVVQTTDAGEDKGIHFLVMEYVDGCDLSRISREHKQWAVTDACELVRLTAIGLKYAHERKLVHRDVKPSNLMLNRVGQLKILDLGLARLTEEDDDSVDLAGHDTVVDIDTVDGDFVPDLTVTKSGQMLGTADYMAPEQAEDIRQADHRADIYSLGCTLFRLLTGRVPYPALTETESMQCHQDAPIPRVRELRPNVPQELDDVCFKMLQKSPADRFQSMQELIRAMENGPWRQKSFIEPPPFDVSEEIFDLIQAFRNRYSRTGMSRERQVAWAVGVIGTAALVAMLVMFFWGPSTDGTTQAPPTAPQVTVTEDVTTIRVHKSRVTSVVFSRDGNRIYAGSDDFSISVSDVSPPKFWKRLVGHAKYVRGLAIAHDDSYCLSVDEKGMVRYWSDANADRVIKLQDHESALFDIATFHDSNRFVAGSADGTVVVWDLDKSHEVQRWNGGDVITSVAVSRNDDFVVCGTGQSVIRWDCKSGKRIRLDSTPDIVMSVDTSPVSDMIAVGCEGGVVGLIDRSGEFIELISHVEKSHQDGVNGVHFSPDGKLLASVCRDGILNIWDLDRNEITYQQKSMGEGRNTDEEAPIPDPNIRAVAFSPDGKMVATGDHQHRVRLWYLKDLKK